MTALHTVVRMCEAWMFPPHCFEVLPSLCGCSSLYHFSVSPTQVAVLADTSFNAEAVDEVAARHMNADCVVCVALASKCSQRYSTT